MARDWRILVSAFSQYCTTRLENAHGTEFRKLLYPWHPWSGLRIGIHEAIERPGGVVFRCDLTASDANRWLEIPAWMFDRSACAKVRLAVEPHTDLSVLVMLGALLRDVLGDARVPGFQHLYNLCHVPLG